MFLNKPYFRELKLFFFGIPNFLLAPLFLDTRPPSRPPFLFQNGESLLGSGRFFVGSSFTTLPFFLLFTQDGAETVDVFCKHSQSDIAFEPWFR